jgi:RNA:NAD 2'-phosphotransferase (TPT1/KptA family)
METEKAYNPSQPRDPKGVVTGGRWASVRSARIAEAGYKRAEEAEKAKLRPEFRDWSDEITQLFRRHTEAEHEFDRAEAKHDKEGMDAARAKVFTTYDAYMSALQGHKPVADEGDDDLGRNRYAPDDSDPGLPSGDPLYHGTTDAVLDKIMKEGIKPGTRKTRSYSESMYYQGSRAKSVFLTADEEEARTYSQVATEAAKKRGQAVAPVVFRVKLPDDTQIYNDEGDDTAFRLRERVKPEWIESAQQWDGKKKKWVDLKIRKEDGRPFLYTVVFVTEDPSSAEKAADKPNGTAVPDDAWGSDFTSINLDEAAPGLVDSFAEKVKQRKGVVPRDRAQVVVDQDFGSDFTDLDVDAAYSPGFVSGLSAKIQQRMGRAKKSDWDESKHPRAPTGTEEGGQFVRAYHGTMAEGDIELEPRQPVLGMKAIYASRDPKHAGEFAQYMGKKGQVISIDVKGPIASRKHVLDVYDQTSSDEGKDNLSDKVRDKLISEGYTGFYEDGAHEGMGIFDASSVSYPGRTKKYSPDQPRDPRGVETGGQWSSVRSERIAESRDKFPEDQLDWQITDPRNPLFGKKDEILHMFREFKDAERARLIVKQAYGDPEQASVYLGAFGYEGGQIEVRRVFGKIGDMDGSSVPGVLHDSFHLPYDLQGQGIAKRFLSDSMDFYQRNGIKLIRLAANSDVGGYAWAKYGFAPPGQGSLMFTHVLQRVRNMPPEVMARVQQSIGKGGKGIWDIADMTAPVKTDWSDEPVPAGKALLEGSDWIGQLRLDDKEAMDRFWNYVGKRRQ